MTATNKKGHALTIGMVLMLVLSGLVSSQPAQAQGKLVPIRIRPLSDTYPAINALRLQFEINQDGKSASGKAVKGSLFARIDVNNEKEQRRTVIGGALLAQQLSGFAPNSQLSVLNFGSETYVLLEGGTLTCVKTDDERLTNGVNDMTSGLDNVTVWTVK